MDFMNAVKNELNNEKTLTENGAVAYATSGKAMVDFNFDIVKLRNSSENEIQKRFMDVFYEDPIKALRYLFYVGDIREGLGERKIFRSCMSWLIETKTDIANTLLKFIPEFNRWDSLFVVGLNAKTNNEVKRIVEEQLTNDLRGYSFNEPISLMAKWMPSENASSYKTKDLARKLRELLGMTPRNYRRTLSMLRKHLDVVEVKTSSNNWSEINYEAVPSNAGLKYKNAFKKHDAERYTAYIDSVNKGEANINAGVLTPVDICKNYIKNDWDNTVRDLDTSLEAMWKNLDGNALENTLVVRDGSGSMTMIRDGKVRPIDVATSLAIFTSECNTGIWKNKYITFSSKPEFVDLTYCTTLHDKLEYSYKFDDWSNTDVYKTMKLILDTAVHNHLAQEEMPKQIIIISDMQFDARGMGFDKSLFDGIAEEYNKNGYSLPRMIFWNAGTCSGTVPMQKGENGVILCSGYSTNILKLFLSNKLDPYAVLLDQIMKPRYDCIEEAISSDM